MQLKYGFAKFFFWQKGAPMFHSKRGERISPSMLSIGLGLTFPIIETKYLRIYKQSFSADAHVKSHSHDHEWEIVLGGPKHFSIYPPETPHDLKWHRFKSWSIISIKIGKKP